MAQKRLTKKQIKSLAERLSYTPRLVWDVIEEREKKRALAFAEDYKAFLDKAKTEREAVACIREMALAKGFTEEVIRGSRKPMVRSFQEKAVALARPGKAPLDQGLHLIVSHIDAPRLDLKQKPLYEEVDLAFFKTHYYGGIKKYQWLARPLALHGRIVKAGGGSLDIAVGENEGDPVFTVLDLLPHLARKAQYNKKLHEAIEGEKLNLIVGGLPLGDTDTKDRFKLAILQHLHEKYGLTEEDFISAELEVVPAGPARDVGWDRALIGAYGQDDRSCAFASLRALLDIGQPQRSSIVLFVDKEEIGSDGATGAKSKFLEAVVYDLMMALEMEPSARVAYEILTRSRALSADVNGALDPDYQDVHEKRNAARMGYGVCVTKFTGHGGKYETNDASAEYVGWLRRLFNENKVVWQTGELGKVDEGGGGTVAKFLAIYGMEVIDCGPPVLSMHSPFEITHKGDIYMTYKGFRAFLDVKS
ncbi:MAG: aminopeptidase [Deltaproteobacteria bacterium]|nr:MAG: aminopeptidase [Deltaproteobacteria bacterium]